MKKSILIVGNFFSSSKGGYSVCEALASHLTASGWNVLTTSGSPGRLRRLLDMVITTWCRRRDYSVAQVDVYSGRAFLCAEAVCRTLRWARKPYILTLHGGNLPVFAKRWPRRVRRLLCSAAAVTIPSDYLLEKMSCYRSDLHCLDNPLEIGACKFQIRKNLQPRMVWLRAFHNIYNPSLAARVVALLSADFPNISLNMVGPDKKDGSLEAFRQLVSELSISDRITIPGAVSRTEVADWLSNSDIFLNTTNVDNTPVSVLEAMASGLCVVSTSVGGIPYLLEHEKTALLVPPNDSIAMATAVHRLLTEPDLAERLSSNARRKAEQFEWSAILPKWQTLLLCVTESKHR